MASQNSMVSEAGHRGVVEGASGSVGAEAVAECELSDKRETVGEELRCWSLKLD